MWRPWFTLVADVREGGRHVRVRAQRRGLLSGSGLGATALERRLCCTWRRSTAVARLDEYMRAECAAHKMVTAVLVVDP